MGRWTERMAAKIAAPPLYPTAKTDKRGSEAAFGSFGSAPGGGCTDFHAPVARPYRMSDADADVAHAEPWTDAVIELFKTRVAAIQRRGFSPQDAEDLAERLHLRDLHADHRHLCLECLHLAGSTAAGWRCRNARAAQVGRGLPAELATLMQSCPGFSSTATRSTT